MAPQTKFASAVHSFTVAAFGGSGHPGRTRHTVPMLGEIDAGLLHHSMKTQSALIEISAESLLNCALPMKFQFCGSCGDSLLLSSCSSRDADSLLGADTHAAALIDNAAVTIQYLIRFITTVLSGLMCNHPCSF